MKTYEIKWKPAGDIFASMATDTVKADNLAEAKRMIESKANSMGAKSVQWYSNRIIDY